MPTSVTQPAATVSLLERVTALSDQVFGFAATLLAARLILDGPPETDALAALLDRVDALAVYAFGFLVIGYQWWRHHRMIRLLTRADGGIARWNLACLAFVAVMPYPTQLLGESQVPLAVGMFIAPLLASSVMMLIMWRHAVRHGLVRADLGGTSPQMVQRRLIVLPIVLLGSLALVPLGAWWAMAAWVLVVPASILDARVNPDRSAASTDDEVGVDDGLARLVSYSDGIYAIVLTLLAEQLGSSDSAATDLTQSQLWDAVAADGTALGAYAITFFSVSLLWVIHVRVLRRAIAISPVLLWMAIVHLLTVALQPFGLSVFADYGFGENRAATVIYLSAMLLAELSVVALGTVLNTSPQLMFEDVTAEQQRAAGVRGLLAIGIWVTAIVIALAVPEGQTSWAFVAFTGFFFLDPLANRIDPTGASSSVL